MRESVVAPENILDGDVIKTVASNGYTTAGRKMKRVGPCEGKPENFHLEHQFYDVRFTTFFLVTK